MITKEVIKALLDEYNKDIRGDLVDYLYKELSKIEDIKMNINYCESQKVALRKDYEEKLDVCNKKLLAVQDKCQHLSKHYNADVDSNSYWNCLICGKYL